MTDRAEQRNACLAVEADLAMTAAVELLGQEKQLSLASSSSPVHLSQCSVVQCF